MNGTLAQQIREKLMPSLERHQGWQGAYTRAGSGRPLTMIPTKPDWLMMDDHTVIEEYGAFTWIVSAEQWARTGFGLPQQSDRFIVTMADGVQRTYALAGEPGKRPYDISATASSYALRMKWVKS
jgi:hypothetical protein